MKKKCIYLFLLFVYVSTFAENKNLDQENNKVDESTEISKKGSAYYSISKYGVVLADKEQWYYEKYNLDNLPIFSVLYEKDILIEKKEWIYNNKILKEKTIIADNKKLHYLYDMHGNVISLIQSSNDDKIEKTFDYEYDSNNRLIVKIENSDGIVKKVKFSYNFEGEKQSEEKFRNDEKISYIEYSKNYKIVHLFDSDKEVGTFKEKIFE